MSEKSNHSVVNWKTCLLSLIIGLILFAGLVLIVGTAGLNEFPTQENLTVQLTIIPAPTVTPVSIVAETDKPSLEIRYVSPEGFTIGAFVQVANTQGAGLKFRSESGTGSDVTFIGMDGDLFKIIDGPDDKSGYSWWKLQGGEDGQLIGWAAADYLSLTAPAADQMN